MMNMQVESEAASERIHIYYELKEFLKTHTVEELLLILADILEMKQLKHR